MITTAKEFMRKNNFKDYEQMNNVFSKRYGHKIKPGESRGKPVKARIDYERLIADCECNGAEYVDPDDLRFFCHSCGNNSNSGYYRPVIIPVKIKKELN